MAQLAPFAAASLLNRLFARKSLNVGSFMKKVFKIEFALRVLKVDLHSFSTLLRQKCGISVSKYNVTAIVDRRQEFNGSPTFFSEEK